MYIYTYIYTHTYTYWILCFPLRGPRQGWDRTLKLRIRSIHVTIISVVIISITIIITTIIIIIISSSRSNMIITTIATITCSIMLFYGRAKDGTARRTGAECAPSSRRNTTNDMKPFNDNDNDDTNYNTH